MRRKTERLKTYYLSIQTDLAANRWKEWVRFAAWCEHRMRRSGWHFALHSVFPNTRFLESLHRRLGIRYETFVGLVHQLPVNVTNTRKTHRQYWTFLHAQFFLSNSHREIISDLWRTRTKTKLIVVSIETQSVEVERTTFRVFIIYNPMYRRLPPSICFGDMLFPYWKENLNQRADRSASIKLIGNISSKENLYVDAINISPH